MKKLAKSEDLHGTRAVITHKRLNLLLATIIAGGLLAISWLLGQRYGASQAMNVAATRLSSVEAQSLIDELHAALQAKQIEADTASNLEQANASRLEALTDQLDAQMRQNLIDANDLELFRQIENSENARSIDIATLEWRSEQPLIIELTLVQWQGRDRISGEVQISLEYNQIPDSAVIEQAAAPVALALAEPQPATEIEDISQLVDLEAVTFDFRFFQNLTLALPSDSGSDKATLSQGMTPEAVIVRIAPADDRLKAVEKRFLWNDIAE